jgi:hypothetical protein
MGWIQLVDSNSNRPYYVNQATGLSQWEPPMQLDILELKESLESTKAELRIANETILLTSEELLKLSDSHNQLLQNENDKDNLISELKLKLDDSEFKLSRAIETRSLQVLPLEVSPEVCIEAEKFSELASAYEKLKEEYNNCCAIKDSTEKEIERLREKLSTQAHIAIVESSSRNLQENSSPNHIASITNSTESTVVLPTENTLSSDTSTRMSKEEALKAFEILAQEMGKPKEEKMQSPIRGLSKLPSSNEVTASPESTETSKLKETKDTKENEKSAEKKSPKPDQLVAPTGIVGSVRRGLLGWFYPNAHDASENLGNKLEAYYDKSTKKWVFPGEDNNQLDIASGPPPTSGFMSASIPTAKSENDIQQSDPLAMLMAPPIRSSISSFNISGLSSSSVGPPTTLGAVPLHSLRPVNPLYMSPLIDPKTNNEIKVWTPTAAVKVKSQSEIPDLTENDIQSERNSSVTAVIHSDSVLESLASECAVVTDNIKDISERILQSEEDSENGIDENT